MFAVTVVALVLALGGIAWAFRERARLRSGLAEGAKRELEAVRSSEELRGELREVKATLRQKEQLAEVGELAAIIAHEVRNPLAIITNAVAGLRRRGTTQADRDTLVAILNEESFRLNRLVRDLLGFTRPMHFRPVQVSLSEVVWRAIDSVEVPPEYRISVEESGDSDTIWGDQNLLAQVVANLVQNAIQASESQGRLLITLGADEHAGEVGVRLTVRDEGEGMAPEVLQRARTPFFTTRASGTGLGLPIVERIVQTHRGEMELRSAPGSGTTVSIFFPSDLGSVSRLPLSPFSPRDSTPSV